MITAHAERSSLPKAFPHSLITTHHQQRTPIVPLQGIALQGHAPSLFTPTSLRRVRRGSRTAPSPPPPRSPKCKTPETSRPLCTPSGVSRPPRPRPGHRRRPQRAADFKARHFTMPLSSSPRPSLASRVALPPTRRRLAPCPLASLCTLASGRDPDRAPHNIRRK